MSDNFTYTINIIQFLTFWILEFDFKELMLYYGFQILIYIIELVLFCTCIYFYVVWKIVLMAIWMMQIGKLN